jgi:hypothetical protein
VDATAIGGAGRGGAWAAARTVAHLGAVSFVASGVSYGLAAGGVTVEAEPSYSPGQSFEAKLVTYYRWFESTLQQERFYASTAILGFLCLAAAVALLRIRLGRLDARVTVGAHAIVAGALLWTVGGVFGLGGHEAVGTMAARGDAIETVHSIRGTVDKVNDAFELAALAVVGAGMVVLAAVVRRVGSTGRTWTWLTLAVGLVALGTASAYTADAFEFVDLLLILGGVVALPAWLVATARLLTDGGVGA